MSIFNMHVKYSIFLVCVNMIQLVFSFANSILTHKTNLVENMKWFICSLRRPHS